MPDNIFGEKSWKSGGERIKLNVAAGIKRKCFAASASVMAGVIKGGDVILIAPRCAHNAARGNGAMRSLMRIIRCDMARLAHRGISRATAPRPLVPLLRAQTARIAT